MTPEDYRTVVFAIDFLPHSSTPEADMAPVPLSESSEILGGYRYWLICNFRHSTSTCLSDKLNVKLTF